MTTTPTSACDDGRAFLAGSQEGDPVLNSGQGLWPCFEFTVDGADTAGEPGNIAEPSEPPQAGGINDDAKDQTGHGIQRFGSHGH